MVDFEEILFKYLYKRAIRYDWKLIHACVKINFDISGHLVKRLKSFLFFVPSDRCCTPWKVADSILRCRVLSGCLDHCSNSLALDYRGLGIYCPRCWNYRNSVVLIQAWNTQIRKNILKVKHGGIWIIKFLSRTGLFLRFKNYLIKIRTKSAGKILRGIEAGVLSEKCMLWSRSWITEVSMRTFEEARGYRKKIVSLILFHLMRKNAVVWQE
jgi:hypothetical protein